MKFSRNPISGILEAYTDDGVYQGEIYTFEDYVFEKEERRKRPFNMDMITTMPLVSETVCFGPCPKPEDEVEQRLTITENGRVYLSRYRFGKGFGEFELIGKQMLKIPYERAEELLDAVGEYFSNENKIEYETDVGTWKLTLTDFVEKTYKAEGTLWADLMTSRGGLSDMIRQYLGIDDLLVFDGGRKGLE